KKWHTLDLRRLCEYVRPKQIKAIRDEEILSIIKEEIEKNNKVVYFVNSTDSFKKLYEKLAKAQIVDSKEISAIVAGNRQNKLEKELENLFGDEHKKLIEISKTTYKSIVEEKVLPEECKILLSTSKLREGIDIMN